MRDAKAAIHQLNPSAKEMPNTAAPLKDGTISKNTYDARARGSKAAPSVKFHRQPVRHRHDHLRRNSQ